MDCKRVGTIHSINNAWAQELLMCSDGFSSFAKEMRPLKMRRAVTSQWKLTTTTWEQLKLLKNSMPTALCLSGIWNKLERWKSSRNRFLMSWLQIKKSSFCHRLLFCATANHFLIGLWHAMESEFHTTTGNDQSVAGPRGNSKALPKAKLATKKSLFGGPLLIWSTTVFWILAKPLYVRSMLRKSARCTKSYNTCSHHLSTERAQFFSTAMPDSMSHHQCFKSWMNWAMKFYITCHYSPDISPTDYHFFKPLDNILQGKHFHNQQEAENAFQEFIESWGVGFYTIGINKFVSKWQKCVECNGSYFD